MANLLNMTITAETDVLRWARVKAAEENTSVSRLVGDILKEKMRQEEGYARARQRHFALLKPVAFKNAGGFRRADVHDRAALRRETK
ncbi:MAG: CopG family transcriptional regulator [Vicinamibacteria bacterium]|jgi:hypothetical protein|nr:CopG family transcriptional regulator [Vicinamibacteria bacterium]